MNAAAESGQIRAVIVDDEQPARRQMLDRLAAHPGIVIVGEADRVKSAADLIRKAKPDVIFLDVQMPDGTGFALLRALDVVIALSFDDDAHYVPLTVIGVLPKPVFYHMVSRMVIRMVSRMVIHMVILRGGGPLRITIW